MVGRTTWYILTALKKLSLLGFILLSGCNKVDLKIVEMRLDKTGLDFIREREAFREYAYHDGIVWAIAYGNTFYENGEPVKRGDRITRQRGEQLFEYIAQDFARQVDGYLTANVSQNQFNALVSYAYNRGIGRFRNTTLLQLVNANPNNIRIKDQFVIEWGTNQTYKNGLISRRKKEAELYFSNTSSVTVFSGISTEGLSIILIILIIGLSYFLRRKN